MIVIARLTIWLFPPLALIQDVLPKELQSMWQAIPNLNPNLSDKLLNHNSMVITYVIRGSFIVSPLQVWTTCGVSLWSYPIQQDNMQFAAHMISWQLVQSSAFCSTDWFALVVSSVNDWELYCHTSYESRGLWNIGSTWGRTPSLSFVMRARD